MIAAEQQKEKIGEELRKLRKEAGLGSYETFAINNGLSRITIYRLESGQNNIQIDTLIKVLEVYGLTLEQFFKRF